MLLYIDRSSMTAIAHHTECSTLLDPFHGPDRPFARMGKEGGWYPVADKEHAQEKVNVNLPGARLIACVTCYEKGALRVLPSGRQEDWNL